ncbi:MAG TPA: Uma2 family endonuclease [Geminicoccaceae bacterium]|nr:Uma2 family endonuclease [Geminicoccaceae bacterium]
MAEPAQRRMGLEEFLDWVERQEVPYELVDGVPVPKYPDDGTPYAMAGGSVDHHTIIGNCTAAIRSRKPAGCRVGPDARIAVEGGTRISDVVTSCSSHEKGARLVVDPVLIVEVLSPATTNIDKGEKFDDYKAIGSLREIWLVDSIGRRVTVARRVPEGWLLSDHIGGGAFRCDVLDGDVTLDELYADTEV